MQDRRHFKRGYIHLDPAPGYDASWLFMIIANELLYYLIIAFVSEVVASSFHTLQS